MDYLRLVIGELESERCRTDKIETTRWSDAEDRPPETTEYGGASECMSVTNVCVCMWLDLIVHSDHQVLYWVFVCVFIRPLCFRPFTTLPTYLTHLTTICYMVCVWSIRILACSSVFFFNDDEISIIKVSNIASSYEKYIRKFNL